MLENLLKGPLVDLIKEKTGLSGDKAEQSAEVSRTVTEETIKKEFAAGNVSQLKNILQTGENSNNEIIQRLSGTMTENLISKVNLDSGMAGKVTGFAIPFIVNKLKEVTNNGDQNQLLKLFGGEGIAGQMKDKLGGLGKMF